ncbi:tetratricopeptide repeat protein [candidate division WWE3 bacterium]|uniref:Tetratricopeptide repeat protein n=1 Tax=candidate division WWE3 bacterium TaxID=2053526 RepID=A0A955LKN6_UNCKA|nr:tetratricopeptide repeat protein [candidate division WWE3 bacterium]
MLSLIKKHAVAVAVTLSVVTLLVVSVFVANAFNESLKQGQVYDYFARAQDAIKEGDYTSAFSLLNEGLTIEPQNQTLLSRQGDVAFLNGDYLLANQLYAQAGITQNAAIYYYEGLTALSKQDIADSLAYMEKSKNQLPEQYETLNITRINATEAAINVLKQTENPFLQQAQIGRLLIDQKASTLAINVLTTLVNDQPNYRDGYYLLGAAYYQKGDLEKAKENIEQTLSIDPNYEPALTLNAKIKS